MENLILFFVIAFAAFLLGWAVSSFVCKPKIMELSDVFTPSPNRSDKRILQDAVMQLQNEIADSGAVKHEALADGKVRVSMKVVV